MWPNLIIILDCQETLFSWYWLDKTWYDESKLRSPGENGPKKEKKWILGGETDEEIL